MEANIILISISIIVAILQSVIIRKLNKIDNDHDDLIILKSKVETMERYIYGDNK